MKALNVYLLSETEPWSYTEWNGAHKSAVFEDCQTKEASVIDSTVDTMLPQYTCMQLSYSTSRSSYILGTCLHISLTMLSLVVQCNNFMFHMVGKRPVSTVPAVRKFHCTLQALGAVLRGGGGGGHICGGQPARIK